MTSHRATTRSVLIGYLFWIFGFMGAHRFYYGKPMATILACMHPCLAGYYRKIFVHWGEGLNLTQDGVKVFDTDFGRIAQAAAT